MRPVLALVLALCACGGQAPQKPAPPLPEIAPELKTALALPQPSSEPLPEPDASLSEPLPAPEPPKRPAPKPAPAAHRMDAMPHITAGKWRVLGPAATRDEYLAHLVTLTRRHLDLLSLSLLAGRRGVTALSILVRGDGTIARISVAQSSGYPDIDRQVERMVAAVGRFPPLPQWIQESSLDIEWSGAVARNAAINFIYAALNSGGVIAALQYAVT